MSPVDEVFEKYNKSHPDAYHAACFTAIDKTGKVLYSNNNGNSKVDGSGAPVTEDSIFWTASMTKIFTATAAMIVVERGLIGLDDDVGAVVSDLADPDILVGFEDEKPILLKAKGKLTLRNLLTHSSGFSYKFTNPDLMKWGTYMGQTDVIGASFDAFRQPLIFEPGEDWAYGPGVDWAGKVVEVLSRKTLDEFIQGNICDRLGLTATTFHPEKHPEYAERKVELAMRGEDGKFSATPLPFPMPAVDDLGGSGIYSTPREFTKLLATLLAGGGNVLKSESVDQIFMPQIKDNKALMAKFTAGPPRMGRLLTSGKTIHQGLSVCINLEQVPNGRCPGSVSWGGHANTFWFIDPKAGVCATMFFQMLPPVDETAIQILDDVEAALYKEIGPV
ncbi:hypothetical protein FQN54_002531 [Arachnomyces sp. PD_36]|nr:hypothetical protein FQN54_002531 [Arachnomyces sp. PD_36]